MDESPRCSMLSMQALFEKFYKHLVEVKHMDRDIAKIKADKDYTMLVLSNIEYEDIKQLVLKNSDLSTDETSKDCLLYTSPSPRDS